MANLLSFLQDAVLCEKIDRPNRVMIVSATLGFLLFLIFFALIVFKKIPDVSNPISLLFSYIIALPFVFAILVSYDFTTSIAFGLTRLIGLILVLSILVAVLNENFKNFISNQYSIIDLILFVIADVIGIVVKYQEFRGDGALGAILAGISIVLQVVIVTLTLKNILSSRVLIYILNLIAILIGVLGSTIGLNALSEIAISAFIISFIIAIYFLIICLNNKVSDDSSEQFHNTTLVTGAILDFAPYGFKLLKYYVNANPSQLSKRKQCYTVINSSIEY